MSIDNGPFNATEPNWELLEAAVVSAELPVHACDEFMWMGEWKEGEHSYKHRGTRKYVRLTESSTDGAAQVKAVRA